MCGVGASLGGDASVMISALRHRGPDAEGHTRVGAVSLAHTRLAILDLDARSDQPFQLGSVALSYNGELWNHRELRAELERRGRTFLTPGDTEVVAAALDEWGEAALPKLEGMFALAWTTDGESLHLARDRFGEVPLHVAKQRPFYAASEVKALLAAGCEPRSLGWLAPGGHAVVTATSYAERRWYEPPVEPRLTSLERGAQDLHDALLRGVDERSISDVPVCTLLSGGLDSAAVALYLRESIGDGLVAYTAVMDPKSPDLRAAREVAGSLGIELREVTIPAPTADDLARVVRAIELPHKAQVEIGWACLHLAERMRRDGFRVTFSGEGSDELWASYGFSFHGLKTSGWHDYRRDVFVGQHRKNFPRCNKAFMASGIECRLPFLHTRLVELALSLPRDAVQSKGRPKAVLQAALRGELPNRIIDRTKMAFQDGLGMKSSAASVVADPKRYYEACFREAFGSADL